ncbi:MAG: hypothetical protein EZS28_035579, partial [Streblomastix strix]
KSTTLEEHLLEFLLFLLLTAGNMLTSQTMEQPVVVVMLKQLLNELTGMQLANVLNARNDDDLNFEIYQQLQNKLDFKNFNEINFYLLYIEQLLSAYYLQ